jgi:type II secretory pathway pseudopilin PulG
MKQGKTNRVHTRTPELGFTLIEALMAGAVITLGMLVMLAVFAQAVATTQTAQQDQMARQKAIEALESIFTARDTQQITFAAIANQPTGIFTNGFTSLYGAGPDGLAGTADDSTTVSPGCPSAVQCVILPGPDGMLGTADDIVMSLNNYQRQVTITNVLFADGTINPNLKQITVSVLYVAEGLKTQQKTYTVTGLISAYR